MHPSASELNIYSSIEKYLWDGVANSNHELLINQDDIATRIDELRETGHAVLWRVSGGAMANTGSITLLVGVTYIQDPGNIKLLTLLDKVKELLDLTASIPVYIYAAGVPGSIINQLVLSGPIHRLPMVIEPTEFKTRWFSTTLKYGQIR